MVSANVAMLLVSISANADVNVALASKSGVLIKASAQPNNNIAPANKPKPIAPTAKAVLASAKVLNEAA